MSGIAGYIMFRPSGVSAGSKIVPRMLLALTGSSAESTVYAKEDVFMGIGAVDALVHNVSFLQGDRVIVAFHGHLTNKHEIVQSERLSEKGAMESEIISYLYLKYGHGINQKLKGKYCFALWDKERKEMLLSADRYGYGYLYYYCDERWCVFATEIKAILKVLNYRPAPNINGICDIHNFHTVYGNETPFAKVNLLPYGCYAHIANGNVRFEKYWEYIMYPKYEERSKKDLLELAQKKMLDSVRNAIGNQERLGVMITSGLDSRWIAGAVKTLFPEKRPFLYYMNNGMENLAAIRNMSKALGMPLIIYKNEQKDFVEKALNEYVYLTDGHWAIYHFMEGIKGIGRRYSGALLCTGYLCDVSFQPSILRDFYSTSAEGLGDAFIKCFSFLTDHLADRVFTKEFANKLKSRKRERIAESIALFADADSVYQALRFYNMNRGRRHVHFWMNAMNYFVGIATPGTDYDLYDFAMAIPREWRENTKFYISAIVDLFPELGQIVWNKSGEPLWKGEVKKSKRTRRHLELVKYAFLRLTRGKIDFSSPPSSFDRLFRQNRRFREEILGLLLDKRATSRGFYDRTGMERLVGLQRSGRNFGGLFESMISVECLFRRFFD